VNLLPWLARRDGNEVVVDNPENPPPHELLEQKERIHLACRREPPDPQLGIAANGEQHRGPDVRRLGLHPVRVRRPSELLQ
jgi:hypothetical protein